MINRNNYEEYLLMYIDGELSPAEAKAVEAFLQVNPDLKDELELLQQTVLQPEESITFSGKDLLYRKEEGIHLNNYQEYFLLYVDEELNTSEKESVETFVLKNPELQDEFTLLKQTVLPKEAIIFNDKEVLYRKEEKRRPVVISIRWASLAAAIMIGIVALVWVMNSGNKTSGTDPNSFAGKVELKKNTETTPSTQPEKTLPVTVDNGTTLAATDQQKTTQPQQNIKVQQVQQQPSSGQQIAVTPQPKNEQKAVEPQVPYREPDPIAYNPTNKSVTTGSGTTKITSVSTPEVTANNYVQQAVYTEELNTDEEKNKNVYVGALEINTDKVRGFFRKAGRFLSSKVKKEDGDKIQVANIEVNKLK